MVYYFQEKCWDNVCECDESKLGSAGYNKLWYRAVVWEKDSDTERQRDRETERQRDRETGRPRDRGT